MEHVIFRTLALSRQLLAKSKAQIPESKQIFDRGRKLIEENYRILDRAKLPFK